MYDDLTGIILSGGKSSRMGENKSLLKLGNKTVIEHVKELTGEIFSKVILITNDPDEYEFLGLDLYEDIFPGMGPLAGIHSGLTYSLTEKNFVISCDLPFMTRQMIDYLVKYKTDRPVTVAKADGFIQQLCGVYDKSCLRYAEEILKNGEGPESRSDGQNDRKCRVLGLIDIAGAEIIDAGLLPFYKKDMFFNMNKRSDFNFVVSKISD